MGWKALLCLALFAGIRGEAEETIKIGEVNPITGAIESVWDDLSSGHTARDRSGKFGGRRAREKDRIDDRRQSIAGRSDIHDCPKVCDARQSRCHHWRSDLFRDAGRRPDCSSGENSDGHPVGNKPESDWRSATTIFRVCFIDEFQGRVMARFALDNLKAQKAAILTDTKQDYSVGLSGFFKETFVNGAGTVVRGQSYSSGDTDFRAQLTSIKAAGPDVVFLPGYYPEVGIILKQARQLGIIVPFIGCEAWDSPTLLQVAGKAADGCYFSNQFSAGDPGTVVQEFAKVYRAKFETLPDNFAALGYDAANVILDAIKRADSTNPGAIRDAIAQTKDFPGVSGNITIDSRRNASKPAVILAIKDQQVQYFEKINPN